MSINKIVSKSGDLKSQDVVNLQEFADTAGVPMEYINKELLLQGQEVSMTDLRSSMLKHIDEIFLNS